MRTQVGLPPAVPTVTISLRDYDAVLFDLDGVLTKTARVHAAAWKKLFDQFLEERAAQTGKPSVPFDIESDYWEHVDGKPRYDGVAAFLEARGIDLPWGTPEDDRDAQTVCALGRRKDRFFQERLAQDKVEVYEPAIALVRKLRAHQIKTAVVSSSNNCAAVLAAAGIAELFDARVDGRDLTRLKLNGKPAPDAFLEGARLLSATPARAMVVEDAVAGVAAGRAGGFGCVIGVDRGGRAQALREAGADAVVTDLGQVQVAAEPASAWSLVFDEFDPAQEGIREAICTLGNGYFATRAAAPEAVADGIHYPGTYLAGGYNSLQTEIDGRLIENEDLVNFPNWLSLQFRIAGQEWFQVRTARILSYRQELDLRRALLSRRIRFEDEKGRITTLAERRFVSMSDMHIAALELSLTAENWSGSLTMRSGIDGRVINAGAKLYRKFNNQHLEPIGSEVIEQESLLLKVRTSQSNLQVAQAARTHVFLEGTPLPIERRLLEEPAYIAQELEIELEQGQTLTLEKVVALFTSRDAAISECGRAACKAIRRASGFQALLAAHERAWKRLWRRFDVQLDLVDASPALNVQMLLRLNMFHLLGTVSPNSIGLDIGLPPRGWTGEAYQGHIFWDELFIFPFFNYRMPEITRSLLLYRYRRLGEARPAAAAAGFRGAMFPWQSGSDGEEVTQKANLNPRSNRWIKDNSYLQRHVGSAVAYNVWQYFQVTRDIEFLHFYGAELILEIARFWSSIATFNPARDRYEIHGVLGPDEFHDAYPDSNEPGLRNNAYTNVMAAWVLRRALDVVDLLSEMRRAELTSRLDFSLEELARWDEISRKMFVPFQEEGIISQFEGYEKLLEFDWANYRARYGNIQRLDLILEAEDDSPNRYKLSKQADLLMLFYLFSAEELGEIFRRLGYPFEHETIPRNVAYYIDHSSHGSTLSNVTAAWVLARSDRRRAADFFVQALQSDIADIQEGTSAEGVHLGAMAGAVDLVERVSTGIEAKDDTLHFNPELPEELARLDMHIRYRGHSLDLRLTHEAFTIRGGNSQAAPISLCVCGERCEFTSGSTKHFRLTKQAAESA